MDDEEFRRDRGRASQEPAASPPPALSPPIAMRVRSTTSSSACAKSHFRPRSNPQRRPEKRFSGRKTVVHRDHHTLKLGRVRHIARCRHVRRTHDVTSAMDVQISCTAARSYPSANRQERGPQGRICRMSGYIAFCHHHIGTAHGLRCELLHHHLRARVENRQRFRRQFQRGTRIEKTAAARDRRGGALSWFLHRPRLMQRLRRCRLGSRR